LSYSCREVSSVEWDNFIKTSPQGTIFSSTTWCNLFPDPYKIYGVYKGDELLGGIIGFLKDGFTSGGYPLTQFQGVICKHLPKYTSAMSLQQRVSNVLIDTLKYDEVTIVNHPSFYDVRPFLWAGWQPMIKYTYEIRSISLADLSKDTRSEIKLHRDTLDIRSMAEFDKPYGDTFEHKGLARPVSYEWLTKLNETLHPIIYSNGHAMAVIICDWCNAYYILGASDHQGYSSSLLYDIFQLYYSVDLCGCNVKEIGDFKAQFGGKLIPYIGVKCIKQQ